MTGKDILSQLIQATAAHTAAVKDARVYLADTSVPLSERWMLFSAITKMAVLGETSTMTAGLQIIHPEWGPFATFDLPRGAAGTFVGLFKAINARVESNLDETLAPISHWMEWVLGNGYSHFTYNWKPNEPI